LLQWKHPAGLCSSIRRRDCIQLCRSDLTAETPIVPGNAHLQPLSDSSSLILPASSSSSNQAKRSYSMEHFRWGKPVGRKRRPIKVFTSNGVEESAQVFPGEMRRRELLAEEEEEEKATEEMEEQQEEDKRDGSYKMKHFRWSGPPASKRYDGFMKTYEGGKRPALFRSIINKDGQQQE
uniref:Proopiomelanocortin n=1 Tax=Acanthochromis polyacanthus TaxID=80966 RepID=A0A3Q1FUG3_9TELE